jgi:hypothetical protein
MAEGDRSGHSPSGYFQKNSSKKTQQSFAETRLKKGVISYGVTSIRVEESINTGCLRNNGD